MFEGWHKNCMQELDLTGLGLIFLNRIFLSGSSLVADWWSLLLTRHVDLETLETTANVKLNPRKPKGGAAFILSMLPPKHVITCVPDPHALQN